MRKTVELDLRDNEIVIVAIDTREGVERAVEARVPMAPEVWEAIGNGNMLVQMVNDAIDDFKQTDRYAQGPVR